MKRTTLRMMVLVIKWAVLRLRSSAMVECSIPGEYVLEVKEDGCVIKHTLAIVCLSGIGNVYDVTHTIEQWREVDNVQERVHVKWEKWHGYYYSYLRQLIDADALRTVAFLPENRKVILEKHVPVDGIKNHFSNTLTQTK